MKDKTPSLSEVKEYFKDAEKIQSIIGRKFKNDGKFRYSKYAMDGDTSIYAKNGKYEVWNQLKGYAKILSYKEPKEETLTITKEQILEIHNNTIDQLVRNKLKNTYPSVFETKLVEFNKWVVTPDYPKWIVKYDKNNDSFYGLTINGEWFHADLDNRNPNQISNVREATEQEVTEALTKECERLGIKYGTYIKDVVTGETVKIEGNYRYYTDNSLKHLRHTLFHNGKFAEIIKTITIPEAEAKLKEIGVNAKIV